MSVNKISYLNRSYDEYRTILLETVKKYYPQLEKNFDDASVGTWLIEMISSIADNLSFHTDRIFNETNINTAQKPSSIYAIARTNGVKIPGPKSSMAEIEFSCEIPSVTAGNTNDSSQLGIPDWKYAPVIKKGTRVSSGSQVFEIMHNIDFAEAFNDNGEANQEILPIKNGSKTSYKITKKDVVVAGERKIYKQIINVNNLVPFMEVIIPDNRITEIESIIFKSGTNYSINPTLTEFATDKEYNYDDDKKITTYRFFEVNSLVDQYRWGDKITAEGNESEPQNKVFVYGYPKENGSNECIPTATIVKGEWKPLTQKFITEYTDKGYLKIIFGAGESVGQNVNIENNLSFSQRQINKMVFNNFLGKLPPSDYTMFILYRTGGGAASNVAAGSINTFSFLNVDIAKTVQNKDMAVLNAVKNSIRCKNTSPSVSGKDSPTIDEIRSMIKYNNGAQERCVCINDYMDRIMKMPPRYGCPFRVNVLEENNKIKIYLLGVNQNGQLTDEIPETLTTNMQTYLSMYRMVNDYVEIESGKIINISMEAEIYVDKNYNASDVINEALLKIKDYMDINKHQIGEDIYLGDLKREISNIDGVTNLIGIRVFNETGVEYSQTLTTQTLVDVNDEAEDNPERRNIDLEDNDYILNSDFDSMFEIKYPENDIKIIAKVR